MSAFTENALVKKLMELNASQQSIQTVSLWLIHHRKHYVNIVKTWYKELLRAPTSKKLTFMYLANDIIQNSKKKGPEYGKEFFKVMKKVFSHIGDVCSTEDRTINSLSRILKIWGERGVYDEKSIEDYRNQLVKEVKKAPEIAEPQIVNGSEKRPHERSHERTSDKKSGRAAERSRSQENHQKKKVKRSKSKEEPQPDPTQFVLSPKAPPVEAPDYDELIKAIMSLENSASSDVNVRELIASFPPEVSEVTLLSKLEDKDAAAKLAAQVNEATNVLHDYNTRLAAEMDDRKHLQAMLKAFQTEQKELLLQAEQRLEEYNAKLVKVKDVQKEIQNHLKNLPDLTQLPDVTGGLAPLPSAGDLFNIH